MRMAHPLLRAEFVMRWRFPKRSMLPVLALAAPLLGQPGAANADEFLRTLKVGSGETLEIRLDQGDVELIAVLGTELRIEAGAFAGKPVYFELIGPWQEPRGTPDVSICRVSSPVEREIARAKQELGVFSEAAVKIAILSTFASIARRIPSSFGTNAE